MKLSTGSPPATPKTKSNEELELLKKILIEAKQFREPARDNCQRPATAKRKRVAGVQKGDLQGRRGAV
jgi:hypothetical protein